MLCFFSISPIDLFLVIKSFLLRYIAIWVKEDVRGEIAQRITEKFRVLTESSKGPVVVFMSHSYSDRDSKGINYVENCQTVNIEVHALPSSAIYEEENENE